MTRIAFLGLAVAATFYAGIANVNADPVNFTTNATAIQTIDAPLFGGQFMIATDGFQKFNVDPMTGIADVDSIFVGNDLPDPLNPGTFLEYELYNTDTTGTITENTDGLFDVSFDVLFELEVTSGPLSGLIVETLDPAAFLAMDLELPWQDGATFDSPGAVDLFVKFDPTGTFAPGTFVGTSFDRSVVNNFVVPEPSIGILGCILMTATIGRRRR